MSTDFQPLQFPDLILYEDYAGDFSKFDLDVYERFRIDFIDTRPHYNGVRLKLKVLPKVGERECTYYHITHEGEDEQNRTPDIRRMERIGLIKFMVNNSNHPSLKVWENKRGRDERVLIFSEEHDYIVVLNKRKESILLWTAYIVSERRKRKLMAEYNAYINTNAAQQN